jgi:hypothetical protein
MLPRKYDLADWRFPSGVMNFQLDYSFKPPAGGGNVVALCKPHISTGPIDQNEQRKRIPYCTLGIAPLENLISSIRVLYKE